MFREGAYPILMWALALGIPAVGALLWAVLSLDDERGGYE